MASNCTWAQLSYPKCKYVWESYIPNFLLPPPHSRTSTILNKCADIAIRNVIVVIAARNNGMVLCHRTRISRFAFFRPSVLSSVCPYDRPSFRLPHVILADRKSNDMINDDERNDDKVVTFEEPSGTCSSLVFSIKTHLCFHTESTTPTLLTLGSPRPPSPYSPV